MIRNPSAVNHKCIIQPCEFKSFKTINLLSHRLLIRSRFDCCFFSSCFFFLSFFCFPSFSSLSLGSVAWRLAGSEAELVCGECACVIVSRRDTHHTRAGEICPSARLLTGWLAVLCAGPRRRVQRSELLALAQLIHSRFSPVLAENSRTRKTRKSESERESGEQKGQPTARRNPFHSRYC